MSKLRQISYFRYLISSIFVIIVVFCVACSQGTTPNVHKQKTPATAVPSGVLPGQQIWNQGVSSFLFGTNDTYEWTPQNIETQPVIQEAIRSAGFTLIRSFFRDNASDATIEQRIQTIENSGAHCLGVITNIFNVSYDEHLVRYLGNRCLMYEFGNEPDGNGIPSNTYLNQWNTVIPLLRHSNPNAKFIGPVDGPATSGYLKAFLHGVKASGTLPDAVSFHWYPCWHDTQEQCLSKARTAGQQAQGVIALVRNILGKDLPVGITEWNFDPGSNPSYEEDQDFITQFSTYALESMIQAGVVFACQFDAASFANYGHLDMFDTSNIAPKAQYYAIKSLIAQYRPSQSSIRSSMPGQPLGPLISRGKPTYCSTNNVGPGGAEAIVSGHYGVWSFWNVPDSQLPGWCAIDVGTGPTRLLLTWECDFNGSDYMNDSASTPRDYLISVSSDSTNGTDGTWQTIVNVTGNQVSMREHLLTFSGKSWVKMTVTSGQSQASHEDISINQIDLYDASVNDSLNDTFFFSGDSITAIAFNRFDDNQPSFAVDVHNTFPQRFPITIDGGIGGAASTFAVQNIHTWLSLNPDMHYWLLEWGTNDAFGMASPEGFRANLQIIINKIKQAGHVPILARLPYINKAGALNQEIQSLNSVIDQVTADNGLIAGPDLYQLFQAHAQEYLGSDGIHPSPAGARAINLAWFQALQSHL